MNCPFTHTSCDKECEIYSDGCTFKGVIVQVATLLNSTFFGTTTGLYEVKEKPNAKSTRKKAKSPSKEKRVRKAKD